jgi:hypothetical protein
MNATDPCARCGHALQRHARGYRYGGEHVTHRPCMFLLATDAPTVQRWCPCENFVRMPTAKTRHQKHVDELARIQSELRAIDLNDRATPSVLVQLAAAVEALQTEIMERFLDVADVVARAPRAQSTTAALSPCPRCGTTVPTTFRAGELTYRCPRCAAEIRAGMNELTSTVRPLMKSAPTSRVQVLTADGRCDHCGKPEAFNVLCPECEELACSECGRVECCCG